MGEKGELKKANKEILCKAWKCLRNYVLVSDCGGGRQKCSLCLHLHLYMGSRSGRRD